MLSARGEQLNSILNVTIVYPGGNMNSWGFFCGRINEKLVLAEKTPLT